MLRDINQRERPYIPIGYIWREARAKVRSSRVRREAPFGHKCIIYGVRYICTSRVVWLRRHCNGRRAVSSRARAKRIEQSLRAMHLGAAFAGTPRVCTTHESYKDVSDFCIQMVRCGDASRSGSRCYWAAHVARAHTTSIYNKLWDFCGRRMCICVMRLTGTKKRASS